MVLRVGEVAPTFEAESVNRGWVRLEDYRGRRVLLVFGRYFGCPACYLDFKTLVDRQGEVGEYAEIIYFTQSRPGMARRILGELEAEFPVVPVAREGGYRIYREYGLGRMGLREAVALLSRARKARGEGVRHGEYEGRETQVPGDFVVDGEGVVTWAHRGVLDLDQVLRHLEAGERPPV